MNKLLLKLIKENPEMEILPLIRFNTMIKDWGYSRGVIEKIEKNYVYYFRDEYFIGMPSILDEVSDFLSFGKNELDREIHEIQCNEKITQLKQNGEIVEKILVYIK